MSTMFILTRDINSYNGFGLPPSSDRKTAELTLGGGAASYTVPSNFENWIAIFGIEPGARVWVAVNHTATIPAGATFANSSSALNPIGVQVKGGDVLSCLTPDATADVSISLYALGNNV